MATNIEVLTAGTVVKSVPRKIQFQTMEVVEVTVPLTDSSVAAQVATQTTITVPGVALTDFVLLAPGVNPGGLVGVAHVSAADTVRITFFNVEGTDAVTTLSTGATARLLILKGRTGFANN